MSVQKRPHTAGQVAQAFRLTHWGFPLSVSFRDEADYPLFQGVDWQADSLYSRGGQLVCRVEATVPDRDIGKPVSVAIERRMDWRNIDHAFDSGQPEFLWQWVRGCIQSLLLHELDEAFTVGGQRLFDPHAGE